MNLKRIGILLQKELRQGGSNLLFVMAIVMPILLSLLISLVFGDVLSQSPRLGIFDEGSSALAANLTARDGIDVRSYNSAADLEAAVSRGSVEVGLVLQAGLDDALQNREPVDFVSFRWGEAGITNLLLIESAIGDAFIETAGIELPVDVNPIQLGSANTASWSERLLPLLIIMSIVLGGLLIPASSLIEEKQRRTLTALTTTPATLLDVYLAKMLMGFIVSAIMGVIILLLNSAFAGDTALLLLIIGLGALFSAAIGIILGSFSSDMDTFMGIVKVLGIVLYAPGILELFPRIPDWIGRLFPTYYMMNPLLEVSQNGAGLGDIALDLIILAALTVALVFFLSRLIGRQAEKLAVAA